MCLFIATHLWIASGIMVDTEVASQYSTIPKLDLKFKTYRHLKNV